MGSLILSLVIALFIPAENVMAAPGDIGEPLSSYNLGYAKTLEGKCVIVSLYVNTPTKIWTADDISESRLKLKSACEYLENSAKAYDKNVEFIYDFDEISTLKYRLWVSYEASDEAFEDKTDNRIRFFVRRATDYEALLAKYEADNVLTLIYFKDSGRPYAITYDGEDIPEETAVLYGDASATEYAHEILHLFGAHDYYSGAEYTSAVTDYIDSICPDEIMLNTDEDNGRIKAVISDVTAYHIGWTDELNILGSYPELAREGVTSGNE